MWFSLVFFLLCAELALTDLMFAEVILLNRCFDIGDRGIKNLLKCRLFIRKGESKAEPRNHLVVMGMLLISRTILSESI